MVPATSIGRVNFGMNFVRIAAFAAVLGLSSGLWPIAADAAQTGMASYYKHGSRTANGERFNPHGLTAAHRTFPFGSRVLVTNIKTGQSVIVRINDRGPFSGGRVIDLSLGAAKVVGLTQSGVAKVKLVRTRLSASGALSQARPVQHRDRAAVGGIEMRLHRGRGLGRVAAVQPRMISRCCSSVASACPARGSIRWRQRSSWAFEISIVPHSRGRLLMLGDGAVKFVIMRDRFGELPPLHGALMAGQNVMQAVGVFLAHVRCRLGRALHFERAADQEGLLDFLAVHPGRARGRLRHHIHQMLVRQALHRLPHRGARDVELQGDGLLVDHLAGLDGAREDQAPHHGIDLVPQGAGPVEPMGGEIEAHAVILI